MLIQDFFPIEKKPFGEFGATGKGRVFLEHRPLLYQSPTTALVLQSGVWDDAQSLLRATVWLVRSDLLHSYLQSKAQSQGGWCSRLPHFKYGKEILMVLVSG